MSTTWAHKKVKGERERFLERHKANLKRFWRHGALQDKRSETDTKKWGEKKRGPCVHSAVGLFLRSVWLFPS